MHMRSLLLLLGRYLVPLACLTTFVLYSYPIFQGCAFPSKDGSILTAFRDTIDRHLVKQKPLETDPTSSLAPFRLLILADPQLEGDSSLPSPEDDLIPKLANHTSTLFKTQVTVLPRVFLEIVFEIITKNIPDTIRGLRKRVDLFGNDFYLAHIYRTLHWWTKPSHVTVLGDLIGSQWVKDEEFEWRGWRYWNRAFAGGQFIEETITALEAEDKENVFVLNNEDWNRKIINIAGNHDIGYAGDISEKRIERFERVFGKSNWDVRFEYPFGSNTSDERSNIPSIHMIVLNSLLFDTLAMSDDLQADTYNYVNTLVSKRIRPVEDNSSFTLLLTHVPLHKKPGVCVDPPHFDFWGDDDGNGTYIPRGLKEQNHLSDYASQKIILENMFGMSGNLDDPMQGQGRKGLILTGHDHEGCDTFHFVPADTVKSHSAEGGEDDDEPKTEWDAVRWKQANMSVAHTGLREVTLRSMMGEYAGNAGLLSAWFDFESKNWKYDIQMCRFGIQHYWWTVHIIDLIAVVVIILNMTLPSQTAPPKRAIHVSSPKVKLT